jgi:hypothetical protein
MLKRFSSRSGRLSHVFLKDRLAGAKNIPAHRWVLPIVGI